MRTLARAASRSASTDRRCEATTTGQDCGEATTTGRDRNEATTTDRDCGGATTTDRGRGGARTDRDRGGATICLLAAGLVFVLAGLFGAGVGTARLARQQARVAADFGALAGAARALQDEPTACARAAEIVAANGARLVRCQLDGLDVLVTAELSLEPLPGLRRVATVTSRAGPLRG